MFISSTKAIIELVNKSEEWIDQKNIIFLGTAVFELELESTLVITHEHSHVNTISPSATASKTKWCANKYMIDAILCYVHRICKEMHLNICKETCYIKKGTFERKKVLSQLPKRVPTTHQLESAQDLKIRFGSLGTQVEVCTTFMTKMRTNFFLTPT